MKLTVIRNATFAFSLFLALGSAQAAPQRPIFSSGDWTLWDSNPRDANAGSCIANTAGRLGRSVYSMELVVDKTGLRPLELFIRAEKGSTAISGFQMEARRGETYGFAKLSPPQDGREIFWYVPTDTEAFVNAIKAANQLNFFPISGSNEHLPLSMAGSTATIRELVKRCTANSLFTAKEFEQLFLPVNKDIQFADITVPKAERLRTLLAEGLIAYKRVLSLQLDLKRLEANFATQLKERDTVIAAINQISGRDLPTLRQAQINAQNAIDQANASILSIQQEITNQRSALEAAEQQKQEASENLRPFVAEHNRLLSIRQNDASQLGVAENSLVAIDDAIQMRQQEIQNLNADLDRLRFGLSEAQNRLRRAQFDAENADRAQRDFNPRRETEIRLRNSPRLRQLEGEIRDLQGQVQSASQNVRSLEAERQARAQALRQCMIGGLSGITAQTLNAETPERGPRRPGNPGRPFPGRPDRPGRPGPGQPEPDPTPPAPTPPSPGPDCSAQQQALREAEGRLNVAQRQLNILQRQLGSSEQEFQNIRQRIINEVRQIHDELTQRAAFFRQQQQEAQFEVGQIEDRVRNILNFDLPRAQNDLAQMQNQRPGAARELERARSSLARSSNALESYRRSVNYEALERDVAVTSNRVSELQRGLTKLSRDLSAQQKLVTDKSNLREKLGQQIASAESLLLQKQTRLGELDQSLADFDRQKAELEASINDAMNALKPIADEYAAELNRA